MSATIQAPPLPRDADVPAADVELALRGDPDASRRIVEALQRPVVATIYRFLGSRVAAEVEDIAQDIFLKVFRGLRRFEPGRGVKLATWVFSIAKNHCFDLAKKRCIKTVSLDRESATRCPEPRDPAARDPSDSAELAELGQLIERAVLELPPCQRFAFILREYEGLDYRTIAEVMNTNEGTTKSRLHRARSALQLKLARPSPAGERARDENPETPGGLRV